ncbi:hypothetical protein Tco_1144806 [Tanacetum coccineum]
MSSASSKKFKIGDDAVNVEAPSTGVHTGKSSALLSHVSQEEVAAPSHSQDIPDAPAEVLSNIASSGTTHASYFKSLVPRKKRLGRSRIDTLDKYFKSLRESSLVTSADLMTFYDVWRHFISDTDTLRYVSYPLSVKLMERMLKHKLEIDKDVVGNDMTTAEQLIRFIKNQLAAAQVSPA